MGPRVAFLSFRFGDSDGVSVVARTWMDAFQAFGFDVVTITGDALADRTVPGLAIPGTPGATDRPVDEMTEALRLATADVELTVVENLLTIPINLAASRAAAAALAGRPALVHHHDPPWHRERFAHITELPATDPAWRHVAINHGLRSELADRGIDATVIYNGFAAPPPRDATELALLRAEVRTAVGLGRDDLVVAHPVRAIERKNIPAAIALCEQLGATYWLLGPAEEGFGPELERLLDAATCPVVHRPWTDTAGIYAAADHVAFPSTWEGFGNPPIEAALHRRTVSVGHYPVAEELRALGFRWFEPDEVEAVADAVREPSSPATTELLDTNQTIASSRFSIGRMRADLHRVLDEAGWMP